MAKEYDVIIVGAGVIGAAVARSLLLRKKAGSVAVLEKEVEPAMHTSGRNSGVLHSGFNLKPGSLKAKFCVEGNARLRAFCLEKKLPFSPVGTVVVAQTQKEISTLDEIFRRGTANGTPGLRIIDGAEMRRLEPNARGTAAMHAPSGGIASGKAVTNALVDEAKSLGAEFFFNQRVNRFEESGAGYVVKTADSAFSGKTFVNCAGLYADEVAHAMGAGLDYTIIPFRGEYYRIRAEKSGIINSMIYPVPDLAYPFLGVHWTKTIAGDVIVGPNATIALGRESYKVTDVRLVDTLKMISKKNFWNLFRSKEFRRLTWEQLQVSLSRNRFIAEAKKLVPAVESADFQRGKSGNRAQVVDGKGRLIEDMLIEKKGNALHVLNAVSPGFTCSLPFADHLVDTLTS